MPQTPAERSRAYRERVREEQELLERQRQIDAQTIKAMFARLSALERQLRTLDAKLDIALAVLAGPDDEDWDDALDGDVELEDEALMAEANPPLSGPIPAAVPSTEPSISTPGPAQVTPQEAPQEPPQEPPAPPAESPKQAIPLGPVPPPRRTLGQAAALFAAQERGQ